MAQQRLSYSSNDLNGYINNPYPPISNKPQLSANKSTSHLEINYNDHVHYHNKPNLKQSKSQQHVKTNNKPLQLTGYPSGDSSSSSSNTSSHINTNNNNTNNNNNNNKEKEKKTIYKFKSGEQFVSYPYLTPQKIIGEGSYASVCSAIDIRTKKKYAIKKNRNAFVNIGDAKRILREIKLMYHFQGHPNLMSVIDVIPPDIGTQQQFNDVYLIMPKMHMTLSKLIMKTSIGKIKLFESDIQTIIYQICRGLQYMHSGGVIHRDLKPENILINCYYHHCDDENCSIQNKNLWQVRITDFGLARGINNPITSSTEYNQFNTKAIRRNTAANLTEYVVTRYYRAPEVMCCSRLYDSQIDVWSLGCIMGEIYYKKPLFCGTNHLHQLQVIFYFCGTPNDVSWVKMNDAKQWISQLPKHTKKDFKKIFSFYNYCNSGSLQQQQQQQQQQQNEVKTNNTDNTDLFDAQQQQQQSLNISDQNDDKCGIMSDLAVDFLDKLLLVNPAKRWDISTVLKHSWLRNLYKQNDYHQCQPFDTSFESEPILRTNFGVRHMMYEELLRIHKHCKNNLIPQKK